MRKILLFTAVWLFVSFPGYAQEEGTTPPPSDEGMTNTTPNSYSATPKHMWEIGVHGGHFMNVGDIEFDPSWGAGIHIRRALDYIFSLRLDLMYGQPKGGAERAGVDIQDYTTTWISGSLLGVVSLNNLHWSRPKRNTNFYALVGGGINYFKTEYVFIKMDNTTEDRVLDFEPLAHADVGLGIAFKISKKVNLGIEHKATAIFGNKADLVDAWDNPGYPQTSFRDILNYTNIRLNFNLGKSEEKSEPLYWVNPMEGVLTDISELKARPKLDLTDTDNDGVIDMMDQENDTPEGAPVDTRGVALDSDKDGIRDFEDEEPYSPPGFTYNENGVAEQPTYADETMVDDIVRQKIGEWEEEMLGIKRDPNDPDGGSMTNPDGTPRTSGSSGRGGLLALSEKAGLAGWFLPMIHFNLDSDKIRQADYGNLAGIAYVMKQYPNVRIKVQGFTDQTASNDYNENLSYNRAKAAIEFMMTQHNLPRERFVMHYGGETNNLVPTTGSNFMNRRVEFTVAAPDEVDMPAPGSPDSGSNFQGNREGY
ncbi:MAG: OmpA family protein [Saprospiraceae bacterium]